MAKPKESTALAIPDEVKAKIDATRAKLLAKKKEITEKRQSLAGKSESEQSSYLQKYGDSDKVNHDHVARVGELMGNLAVVRQRMGGQAYGEGARATKIVEDAIKKLGEVQGLLTTAAAATMAQSLFPDRYNSSRDDFKDQLREIDTELQNLNRLKKAEDVDEVEQVLESAEVVLEDLDADEDVA
jgi:hypothetical protein